MQRVRARVHAQRRASALEHYQGERPLFDLYGVEDEIEKALARRVDLKSGGYLIIDQTEALTTIDVNTGGFVGGRSFDDTIFKTNLEAAQVIARQLRLRNLGGIIIIDFIDMESDGAPQRGARRAHARRSSATARADRQRLHAARPRRDDAQAHARVARARAVRAVPHVRRAAASSRPRRRSATRSCARSCARRSSSTRASSASSRSQPVIDMFLDEESQSLAHARRDFIGKPISLQVETLYNQEQYDIVLI